MLATIDRGPSSSAYAGTFADRAAWDDLLGAIDVAVGGATGQPAKARRVLLSSFSAGYAGLDEALRVAGDDERLSAVVLLDSLYAGFEGAKSSLTHGQLPRFVAAARRSLEGPRFLFALTHGEVPTEGYASTAETATFLLEELSVRSSRVEVPSTRGLALTRVAEERGFVLRGYTGRDAAAHCAHLGLLPDLLDRWATLR